MEVRSTGAAFAPLGGRLAALRFPCSRLQVQGSPSVASPFSGAKVHWTFAFIRFTPPGPFKGERDVQGVRVPRVQDAYERPSASLILGSTVGAENCIYC